MAKIGEKIKEAVGAVDILSKFQKFSKLKASYIEYDKFADSNLHEGYFCYNCIYWINASGGKCMLVEDSGPDVLGKVSDVIAPMDAVQVMKQTMISYMIQGQMLKIPIKIKKRRPLQM
jgi:hypothetical protein